MGKSLGKGPLVPRNCGHWQRALIIGQVPLLSKASEFAHCLCSLIAYARLKASLRYRAKAMARNTENGGGRRGSRWRIAVWGTAAFILVWLNLAVGIIGTEDNPANLMFGGVPAVGIVGAVIARLQPHGMARALVATALAQALVAVIALTTGLGSTGPSWPGDILVLTGFFAALWVGSALLFRKAAREQVSAGAAW